MFFQCGPFGMIVCPRFFTHSSTSLKTSAEAHGKTAQR